MSTDSSRPPGRSRAPAPMDDSEADSRSKESRLGYQGPRDAFAESDRATALVASALTTDWITDGALLRFPDTPEWTERADRFVREFGRRYPSWETVRLGGRVEGSQPSVNHLTLRIVGPGAEQWLRESVVRSRPQPLLARIQQRARLRERFRTLTPGLRVLPTFFIIGAPRCGTSTLHQALCQHPCIVRPTRKELAFFNVLYAKGLPWYRSQFPTRWERFATRRRTGGFATCDATPTYLLSPHVARRICEITPDARLIVCVRDPVVRAYSHYQWAVHWGYELLSFEDALDREEDRVQGELERMMSDEHYVSLTRRYFSYLLTGTYADQLLAWRRFFPKEQFHVVSTTDLKQRPQETLSETLGFLGLPRIPLPVNARGNSLIYPPMQDKTRARLREYFRPHDERLRDLLGRDPGWIGAL